MSLEKAKVYLKKYGLDDKIIELSVSSATVKEASSALNCSDGEIAKTLSFMVNDRAILIVAAGDQKIDNSKFKAEFQTKAKMLVAEDVEKMVGHAVGGVCPFGVNDNVTVYLDVSLKRFNIIYPACGSSNSVIKLTIEELEKTSNYKKWIDVCKNVQV